MKKLALMVIFFLMFFFSLAGCNQRKEGEARAPAADAPPAESTGNVDDYTQSYDFDKLKLSVTISGDKVSFILVSKYSGWAAVGVGSNTMNQAVMFIGYVDKDGKAFFTEQTGSGHRHSDTPADKRIAENYSIRQEGEVVTLEVQCPLDKVIGSGNKGFPVIIAASNSDSFTSYHAMRRQLMVKLK